MSDASLTRAELEEVRRHHKGKPPTKALHKDSYRNPVHTVRLLGELIERERAKRWRDEK